MVKPGAPPHGCGALGEVMGRGGLVHTPRCRWRTADEQCREWSPEMINLNAGPNFNEGAVSGGHANRS